MTNLNFIQNFLHSLKGISHNVLNVNENIYIREYIRFKDYTLFLLEERFNNKMKQFGKFLKLSVENEGYLQMLHKKTPILIDVIFLWSR